MPDVDRPAMIATESELRELCQYAKSKRQIALDTEFFWERTFYPQLGLVQIGLNENELFLVDAVALPHLPGLDEVMTDTETELILHDAIQDLQILYRHTGTYPKRIFDTRRAAGFAGRSSTCSLANLLADVLSIELPKSETRSNWLQRPLTEKQMAYARDDIRHLPALADAIRERADTLGNTASLNDEMHTYDNTDTYDDPIPDVIYGRFKPYRLKPRQKALLYALTCWREREARKRDRPRGHIMPNSDLMAIAQHAPGDRDALQHVRGLSHKTLMRHRKAILGAIADAQDLSLDQLPETSAEDQKMSSDVKEQIQRIRHRIKTTSEKHGIDPALIGNKAEMTTFIRSVLGQTKTPIPKQLSSGWRAQFLARIAIP